eukprot:TRINITY_DN38261_c0_g1_i1.p1 TRINITY_DN38261_c0_g1~~TRINITY_DN38261_c0_g1_i1.p1  ORF type:complete len:223 (+),score=45.05 TRINITY_DN38261_c0_g1_i1:80-748(+)
MGVIGPAPNVLGGLSLTAAVELLCFINLCVSIGVISMVDSAKSLVMGGMEISSDMQCINAAWFLLGIPAAIYGGVGAIYRVEGMLNTYLYYLVITAFVFGIWTVLIMKYADACTTTQSSGSAGQASFACSATNAMTAFWMFVMLLLDFYAIYLVWSKREYVRERQETELIRYAEPWQMVASLADDVAAEQAREIRAVNPKVTGAAMPATALPQRQGYPQAMF